MAYDKNLDDFTAYFNNKAILHKFERIFIELSSNEEGLNTA